jgi:hypothetical protein
VELQDFSEITVERVEVGIEDVVEPGVVFVFLGEMAPWGNY